MQHTTEGLSEYQLLSVPPFSGHLVPDRPTGLSLHCILNLETGDKEEDETQQVLLRAAHHFLFLPNQLNSLPDGYNQCLKICLLPSSLKPCLNLSS